MHEINTATEEKFDSVLQMTLEHVLAQKMKQGTKWTSYVTNISKYV